jgi:hypothetical protein
MEKTPKPLKDAVQGLQSPLKGLRHASIDVADGLSKVVREGSKELRHKGKLTPKFVASLMTITMSR